MIIKIRHIGIVISDIKKAIHFYRDILGLKIKRKMLETGKYINDILALKKVRVKTVKMSDNNGNLIELLYYESHPRKPLKRDVCDIGYSHISFTVENLASEYRRLKEKGVKFNAPPQRTPDGYARVVYCNDPDGNFIELVEVLHKPRL